MPLSKEIQDFIIETIDDEELADDYAKHDFYCGFHIVGLCTDPKGECTNRKQFRALVS